MSIIGADISFWQTKVDQNKNPIEYPNPSIMKESDSKFVIIRSGQGAWKDRDFYSNWKNFRGILPRGSYWFYDSRYKPKVQAKIYSDTLSGDLGELPLWCDFEDRYGGSWGRWQDWYDFMEHLKELVPNKSLGVYTGYYYWKEFTQGKGIPTSSLNYFKQYPLWIAAYNNSAPSVPKPWDKWTLWQFTDNGDGTLYGVHSKNIDLNYFNGTEEDFNKTFGIVYNRYTVRAVFGTEETVYKEN